ncbi:hypothetical protein GCM10010123_00210 [Pilimelia anulata]|uniref:Uncharacterized protein n=1 Tax=Pilimelia anulata TaxID=53371 RepID=A0A8J3F5N5_9ACTN|nr:hypothetical protein GCM10010123_00210 [Pilimelia anulata]
MLRWALPIWVVLLAGCTAGGPPPTPPPPAPVAVAWRAAEPLPVTGGRAAGRALAYCGRWYLTGATIDAAGGTRPALWTSGDGLAWRAVPVRARSTYGSEHTLYAAACRGGTLVALGAKSGGAHGYPRTSTWSTVGGVLTEEVSAYTLYGGADGLNVGRVAAGPRGWLLAGNRVSGAAAWTSPDGASFTLRAAAPLAHDDRRRAWAADAAGVADGWRLVGYSQGVPATPLAWTSPDGIRWRELPLRADSHGSGSPERVVAVGGAAVAAGVADGTFAAWRIDAEAITPLARFANTAARAVTATGPPSVAALTAHGSSVLALVNDGAAAHLWQSTDAGAQWREQALPAPLPTAAAGGTDLSASAAGLLLLADDGGTTHLWGAPAPPPGAP